MNTAFEVRADATTTTTGEHQSWPPIVKGSAWASRTAIDELMS